MVIKYIITTKHLQHLFIHLKRQPIFISNTSQRNYFKTIKFIIVNHFMHFTRLQIYSNAQVSSKKKKNNKLGAANRILNWKKSTFEPKNKCKN